MNADRPDDRAMMEVALGEARASLEAGGVPVGAALAEGGRLVASGHNERVQLGDPIAHGEIACLRNAGRQPSYLGTTLYTTLSPCQMCSGDAGRQPSYLGTTLYTTLSPCQMCSGAILLFQIPRVVVGEATTFAGDLDFLASHGVDVLLLDDERCRAVMQEFQERYPQVWSEDIGGR